jgi:thioredoxin 1
MSNKLVQDVSTANFEELVLKSAKPVLVDYWAEWCGPCKMVGPVVAEIAEDYKDRIDVCKVDVDENGDIAEKYGVRGIPTLMLFHEGKVLNSKVGALSKNQLCEFIDTQLSKLQPDH